jgi:hypothetical protein
VQRGTTGETWAQENVPEGVQVRGFPEPAGHVHGARAGNVTAVIFDEPSAVTEAGQRPALEVVQTIDTGERYGFAVDPQNEELLTALNETLAEIKEDGTYQQLDDQFEQLPPGGDILEAWHVDGRGRRGSAGRRAPASRSRVLLVPARADDALGCGGRGRITQAAEAIASRSRGRSRAARSTI